jgi:hypothetical protein
VWLMLLSPSLDSLIADPINFWVGVRGHWLLLSRFPLSSCLTLG